MKSSRWLGFIVVVLCGTVAARAAFSPERLAQVDRPPQGRVLALSPDGKRLAYTQYEDDKLWLMIADLDAKTTRAVALDNEARNDGRRPPELQVLRWVGTDRLVMVNAEGAILSADETGRNARLLWGKDDAGLVQDTYMKDEQYLVHAGLPRLLAPLADDPGHLLVESAAIIGQETLSNAWKIDVSTGEAELVAEKDYPAWQVALYGRGDMLLWPPWSFRVEYIDPDLKILMRMIPGSLEQMQVALRNPPPPPPEQPMSYPVPSEESPSVVPDGVVLKNKGVSGATIRSTPFAARLKIEGALQWRPDTPPISPYNGGAVPIEQSSGGRMLYDRQGWPRLLYAEFGDGSAREFRYSKPGGFPFDPIAPLPTLDQVLGQTKGKEFTVSAANYFGERSYPLAFDFDPNVLYFASNVGRDTYGIYALDLTTKERRELAPELKGVDLATGDPKEDQDVLVFDEARKKLAGIRYASLRPKTRWLDAELAAVQEKLDARFPRHAVEIVGWDNARRRFVLRVSAEDDPGAVFIHEPATGRLDKLFSATPWMADGTLNAGTSFAFQTPAGATLSGYLTMPDKPKISPPPVLVYLQGDLWHRAPAGFDPSAEMFADMGFVVMRLNYRGSPGFGRSHFEAIKDGIDTAPAEDVLLALDWLGSRQRVDRKRVVLAGEGLGGYIAMRVAEGHPEAIRAVIGINAPTSLTAWTAWQQIKVNLPMYRNGAVETLTTSDFRTEVRKRLVAQIKDRPSLNRTGVVTLPTLVVESADSMDTTPMSSLLASLGLGGGGLGYERVKIDEDFRTGSSESRAKAFQRIDEFFNEHLYEYGTTVGPLKVLETPPAKK